jgi:hypothetical protein
VKARLTGVLAAAAILAVAALIAGVVYGYLTEYGGQRIVAAAAILAAGMGLAAVAYLALTKYCRNTRRMAAVLLLLAVLIATPILSTIYPGRVTYARFGLTVVGAVPVPLLDITAGPQGGLWFRDKSHFVSLAEVKRLLSPGVEVLIVGTGWQGAVEVEAAIEQMQGIEVHVLRTPAAFALFNDYRIQGRRVVLLAHSTC